MCGNYDYERERMLELERQQQIEQQEDDERQARAEARAKTRLAAKRRADALKAKRAKAAKKGAATRRANRAVAGLATAMSKVGTIELHNGKVVNGSHRITATTGRTKRTNG